MSDDRRPPDPEVRRRSLGVVEDWLDRLVVENPVVQAVERDEDPDVDRWFVRVTGEEKSVFSVWFHMQQRALHVETYVMPAPEENAEQLYEHLLRRTETLVGAHFSIGIEDAVFLRGELPLGLLHEEELDRVIGTMYAAVERIFPVIIRIGFASRFADE